VSDGPVAAPGYRRAAWLRRGGLALFTVLATVVATAQLATVLAGNRGIGALEALLLALFAACFVWIAFSFGASLAGFAALVLGRRQPGLVWPDAAAARRPLASRTAIVMAMYHEDPARVCANLQAIAESLAATGHGAAFDLYMLSDSVDPDAWVAEEMAWHALTRRLGPGARVFYRRRRKNVAKKAGNIADFCTRWGRHYDFMLVLDADSLMDGDTIVRMARLMEANPRAGLVQAPPMCVNRNTLFARMLQFAGRVYGPVFAAGTAFWQLGEGNYWGHNAIIRTAAFMAHCGLPILAGKPPFGGHILSHDFVEAALLRRAGWSVWMAPELAGSYEEVPPTLLDYAKRDHRWCQGNLQHARVLVSQGLHPVSRFHLANGIMSYVASPLWLLFLAIGLALATVNTLLAPDYFGAEKQLFPNWPIFDAALAQGLFLLALGFLLVPRLLGVALTLADERTRRAAGGAPRIVVGAALELVYSTLLAPSMMLLQSRFVFLTLMGRSIDWGTQSRDDRGISWADAARSQVWHTAIGLLLGALAYVLDPAMFLWLSPLVLGLAVSIPLAQLSSRRDIGQRLRAWGLFLIPEETAPPPVLARARAIQAEIAAAAPATVEADGLKRVLGDPVVRAVHVFLLEATGEPPSAEGPELAAARERLAAGAALDRAEKSLLLYDRALLSAAAPSAAAAAL
jgi:membrane glycosyltransferase